MSVIPGTIAPPVVPYGPPPTGSVTPPQGSFTQGDIPSVSTQGSSGSSDMDSMKKLLLAVITHAQQNSKLAQPVPSPVPQPGNAQAPQGGIQKGSGARSILPAIANFIQSGVSVHKQNELAKAESAWNQFGALVDSGDQQKAQLWVASHEKDLKGMAKALNQDWLNPEKTTVYKQALDSYLQKKQAKDQAATGLKAKFQELIGKAFGKSDSKNVMQNLSPDQQAAMSKEIMDKAPISTATTGPELKDLNATMKNIIDMNKNEEDAAYKRASLAATQEEKAAALEQAKAISEQNLQLKKMQQEYEQGNLAERSRHDKAIEGIDRTKANKKDAGVSAAEQDKRAKLAGATASVGQIVSKYQGKGDNEKVDPEDQQLLSGMFNVVTGAGLPKTTQSFMSQVFSSGAMTVGQARKVQKLLGNFKPSSGGSSDDGVGFTPSN